MKRALQIIVAVLVLLLTGALARYPLRTNAAEESLLRLSWRTRGEASQQCRNRTQAELDALPAHMRTPQVCTGTVASYRLELSVDGQRFPALRLHAAGAHADRPIYVFKEVPLHPGTHTVAVEFFSTLHPRASRLQLHESITVGEGEIALVTVDSDTGELVVRQ